MDNLENIRKKVEAQKKNKPFTRKTIVIGPDGKRKVITEHITLSEFIEEDELYIENPEDPDFRRTMEEDQW